MAVEAKVALENWKEKRMQNTTETVRHCKRDRTVDCRGWEMKEEKEAR